MSTNQELAELLRAERGVQPPPLAVERGWSRLASGLAGNVASLPIATGPLKLGWWMVPKWIIAGFACGLVGSGAVVSALAPAVTAKQSSRGTFDPIVVQTATRALPSSTEAEPQAVPSALPGRRGSNERSRIVTAPSAPSSATFDAELRLISLAKSEIDAHRPSQARAWLSEHAAGFPLGVFATEREALLVLVLCQEGAGGRASAEKFALQHPTSPLVTRLRKACMSSPSVVSSARASFPTLPNGSAGLGERTNESNTGEGR
jgi:hypothetical protein